MTKRGWRRRVLAVSAVGLIAASCSSDKPSTKDATSASAAATPATAAATTPEVAVTEAPVATDAPAAAAGEGWTVLMYSIADTDLEPYLLTDLGEMAQVGSNANLHIQALVDRAAAYSSDPLLNLPDWQGGKLMTIEQGSMTEEQDLGDVDTGDPALLSQFITQGIAKYPAAHYALILSDHGASWPGVGGDESSNSNSLTLAEIHDAISSGLGAAGVDKLDLLGFDACLMATYEVASAVAPLADRLVASQELEPGHGWDYTALQVLAADPTTTADTFAAAIIDGFSAQADAEGTKSSITLSEIDLTKMGAVQDALSAFTGQLTERVADVAPKVGQSLATSLGFGNSPDPTEDTQMTDLGVLAGEIGVKALDVSDAADTLIRAINDVVVKSVVGAATRGATGLSIYFPPNPELLSSDYAGLATPGGWADFLNAYYHAGDAISAEEQPQFQNAGDVAETTFDDSGLTITGTFDLAAQDNLSEATISYGTVDADGSITFFGDEPAAISEDGSGSVAGVYDLTTLSITDGTETATAYLTLTEDVEAGLVTFEVPMAYYSPEDVGGETYQDALLSLTVDAATGDIVSEIYYAYNAELDTYGELTADPDGIIVPEVFRVAADGSSEWVPTSEAGLSADLPSLQYSFPQLASGTTLYVELTVTDFGGNSDTISATVQVP